MKRLDKRTQEEAKANEQHIVQLTEAYARITGESEEKEQKVQALEAAMREHEEEKEANRRQLQALDQTKALPLLSSFPSRLISVS